MSNRLQDRKTYRQQKEKKQRRKQRPPRVETKSFREPAGSASGQNIRGQNPGHRCYEERQLQSALRAA